MELVTTTDNSEITTINKLPTENYAQKPKSKMEILIKDITVGFIELKTKIKNLELDDPSKYECVDKMQKLESDIRKLEMQNEIIFDDDYNRLLENVRSKQAELQKHDKIISDLEYNISNSEFTMRKLERENKTLKKKAEESAQELEESESQINELDKKYRCLEKELKEYKEKYSNKNDVQKSLDKITDLNQSLKLKENSIKEKENLIAEYKLKATEFQEKYKNLDEEIRKRNIEIEKQNTTIESLKSNIKTLNADNEKKQQAILNMKEKIKRESNGNSDQTNKKLTIINGEIDNEMKMPSCNTTNLNENFNKKCKELELANEKIVELEAEIINMKTSNFSNCSQEFRSSIINTKKVQFPDWWSNHMYK